MRTAQLIDFIQTRGVADAIVERVIAPDRKLAEIKAVEFLNAETAAVSIHQPWTDAWGDVYFTTFTRTPSGAIIDTETRFVVSDPSF